MLLKVFLCVLQIVLRLGRDHRGQSAKTPLSSCVTRYTKTPGENASLAGMKMNQSMSPAPKPGTWRNIH